MTPTWSRWKRRPLGSGRRALDAQGLALAEDGTFWVGDNYGPFIYHFNPRGELLGEIRPPAAFIPRAASGAVAERRIAFGSILAERETLLYGRRPGCGFEGVSLTPDSKLLFAILKRPLAQDSSEATAGNATNTRLLVFDADASSPAFGALKREYVYALHTVSCGEPGTEEATSVTDLIALNEHQFLVLETDPFGRNAEDQDKRGEAPKFKKVMFADTDGAADIAGTGYDIEPGLPGSLTLSGKILPSNPKPIISFELVNLLDYGELSKFGLNAKSEAAGDHDSLSRKWSGLALVPLNDAGAPDDFLLLVGNDNEFRAHQVYSGGAIVARHLHAADSLLLAWRVTIPGAKLLAAGNTDNSPD